MAEYIGCRNCDSPDCKGCNLKNLETMLNNGKFDCLMNENRCINPSEDVALVRHGRWILERKPDGKPYCFHCSVCDDDFHYIGITVAYDYCPNCGAKMYGDRKEGADNGKTVFLTREEAEAAIEKMKEENNGEKDT